MILMNIFYMVIELSSQKNHKSKKWLAIIMTKNKIKRLLPVYVANSYPQLPVSLSFLSSRYLI